MNHSAQFVKTCLFAIVFILAHHQLTAQSSQARSNALRKLDRAAKSAEQEIQAAAMAWEDIGNDIASGAGLAPQTASKVDYIKSVLQGLQSEIQIIGSRARFLDANQVISDVQLIDVARSNCQVVLNTMRQDIANSTYPDSIDAAAAGADMRELLRLIDCIRREIQDIGNGG